MTCHPTTLDTTTQAKLLHEVSPANREPFAAYLDHMTSRKRSPHTARLLAYTLRELGAVAGDRDLRTLRPQEWTTVLARFSEGRSKSTVHACASYARAYLIWHAGAPEDLDVKTRRVFRVERPDSAERKVLTEDERDAMLRAASEARYVGTGPRNQAFLWTLWDTGCREGEALSMRIKDVTPDAVGGAHVHFPRGKTGSRTVYVVEAATALKIWLELHPHKGDPDAPLWPGKKAKTAMSASNVTQLLRTACVKGRVRVVLDAKGRPDTEVHPHLFRHTRATRAARGDTVRGIAPWNEAQMRGYFGWKPKSNMPAHYVHLAMRDMEERVRADAGADPLAAAVRADPLGMMAKLAGMVAAETADRLEKGRAIDVRRSEVPTLPA